MAGPRRSAPRPSGRPPRKAGGQPGGSGGAPRKATPKKAVATKKAAGGSAKEPAESGTGRHPHLTSRAAILAIVMCAIALSLAYPIREYIAQRREISQLRDQERGAQQLVEQLAQQKQRLGDESYIKREARRRLHYCMPNEKCFVVLGGEGAAGQGGRQGSGPRTPPWYVSLWRSVEAADKHR